jgi:hypothetical protein
MVGISVDGYFFPADSQLVSALVQVLVEARLSMSLLTRCEGVSDELPLYEFGRLQYYLNVLMMEFYVEA